MNEIDTTCDSKVSDEVNTNDDYLLDCAIIME